MSVLERINAHKKLINNLEEMIQINKDAMDDHFENSEFAVVMECKDAIIEMRQDQAKHRLHICQLIRSGECDYEAYDAN